MGERQKRAGQIQPDEAPEFMKPKDENAPSLRSGFRNDSEALYVPSGSSFDNMSPEELALH